MPTDAATGPTCQSHRGSCPRTPSRCACGRAARRGVDVADHRRHDGHDDPGTCRRHASSIDGNGVVADDDRRGCAQGRPGHHVPSRPTAPVGRHRHPAHLGARPCATNGIARANTMNGVTTARRASTRRAPIRDHHDDGEQRRLDDGRRDGVAGGSGDDHREGDRAHARPQGPAMDRRVDCHVEPTQVAPCEPDTVRAPPCPISSMTSHWSDRRGDPRVASREAVDDQQGHRDPGQTCDRQAQLSVADAAGGVVGEGLPGTAWVPCPVEESRVPEPPARGRRGRRRRTG